MTVEQEREYREYLLENFKKWELTGIDLKSRTFLECYMKFDEIITHFDKKIYHIDEIKKED